jgi:RNA polymerase sigma-70 factor (ECF subfamily)
MPEDFLKMITEHQNILHKVCHLYTDTSEDREDLFQEILIQLWKSMHQFKKESKLSTWMYKVALHTAFTYLKRSKKSASHQQGIQESMDYQHLPDRYDERDYDRLDKAIAQLNQVDKAITLMYLEKHSYQEIAELMGISETNVGVKINRIKAKLKTIMQEQHG